MNYRYEDKLRSERLITRFLTEDDIPFWVPFIDHPTATQFLNPDRSKSSEEIARHWFLRQMERYTEQTFGLQAILEKFSGRFLGICGLLLQTVDGKQEVEVGYHFLPENWGNGYATEAAKIFIDYAFQNDITDSVVSIIDVENYASIKVAERNGLIREKRIKYLDNEDVFIFRICRANKKAKIG